MCFFCYFLGKKGNIKDLKKLGHAQSNCRTYRRCTDKQLTTNFFSAEWVTKFSEVWGSGEWELRYYYMICSMYFM